MHTAAPFRVTSGGHRFGLGIDDLHSFEAVSRMGSRLGVSFYELTWDNFQHLSPQAFEDLIARLEAPVALHVTWSRFGERRTGEIAPLLDRLRRHASPRTLYVADHVLSFCRRGAPLPSGMPLDEHAVDVPRWIDAIHRYQDVVGHRLLLENAALGRSDDAVWQIDLVSQLMDATGCGLLFDVTNAVTSHRNGAEATKDWTSLIASGGQPVHARVRASSAPIDGLVASYHQKLVLDGLLASTALDHHGLGAPSSVQAELRRLQHGAEPPWQPDEAIGRHTQPGRDGIQAGMAEEDNRDAPTEPLPDGMWWTDPLRRVASDRAPAAMEAVELWLENHDGRAATYLALIDEQCHIAYLARRSTEPGQPPYLARTAAAFTGRSIAFGYSFLEFEDDLAVRAALTGEIACEGPAARA